MRYFALVLVSSFLFSPLVSFAADVLVPPAYTPTEIPEGLSSCFDFYRFGSIPVTLTGNTETIGAGTDMTLFGTAKNENEYPVSGLKIYAKLLRIDTVEKTVTGPDVIDEFLVTDTEAFGGDYATKGFTLTAGEELPFTLTYTLPAGLADGTYRVALFVIANDRFNMTGLSFTDDVVGSNYGFNLVGGGNGTLRFDRSSFTVAGREHHFVAFPSQIFPTEDVVPVEGKIVNDTESTISGTLTLTLYHWDQRRSDQMIETRTKPVVVPPGGSISVSYELFDKRYPVYQLVGELSTEQGSSFINVRMSRNDRNEPRINSQGIASTDDGAVAFACVHNTGKAKQIEDTNVLLKVETNGFFTRTLAEKKYFGSVPGDLAALSVPVSFFLPQSRIFVTTVVERGGTTIDSVTSVYSCKDFNACPLLSLESIVAWVIALLVFGFGFLAFRKKRTMNV